MLELGKLTPQKFKELVAPYLPLIADELDANPLPGEGLLVSSNPALGLPLRTLGFFAFHYSASNLAVAFARPKYISLTVLLPPGSREEDLKCIVNEFGREARRYGVSVIGGHTGVYRGLEAPVAVSTAIGIRVRERLRPEPGDKLVLIGKIGAESLWLASLKGMVKLPEDYWRRLTPLPLALKLVNDSDVKLIHDVSEGGLLRALTDISVKFSVKIGVKSSSLPVEEGLKVLNLDPLRAPSYGSLVAVVRDGWEPKTDLPHSAIGEVREGSGVFIDGAEVKLAGRTYVDEIYGEYTYSTDPVLNSLKKAFKDIEGEPKLAELIPEVGLNLVYAREGCRGLNDIAGLSGRVIRCLGKPKVCGEVIYGGSKHLAQVLLNAMKLRSEYRAAVNVKGDLKYFKKLEEVGLKVTIVPPRVSESPCPIADYLREAGKLFDAYYHPGAHGIEPSIVILGKDPEELLGILRRLVSNGKP